MIEKLENIILELEAKALQGADVWQQINKLKLLVKELENEKDLH